MVAVILHQPLSDRFGKEHEFQVRSPREAVAALDANYPGFLAEFMQLKHHWIVVDGEVRGGPRKDDAELAAIAPASQEIHFVPAIEGNAFLGAALVGWVFPALAGTLAANIIGTVLIVGVLTGLSMLFKKKVPTTKDDEDKKLESYAFSGPENVTAQGATVPLVYGAVHCGTVVVSAGLELGTDLLPTIPPPPPPTAAGYPIGGHGIDPPPQGWPPIIAQSIRRLVPGIAYANIPPHYITETKYGPQGYGWAGQRAINTRVQVRPGVYVNDSYNVDYWRGPQIREGQIYYITGAFRFYGYDRINGFTVFDASKVIGG